ncbi:MAG: hypothetical protein QGH70_09090 [Nitrospinota bacterium]|nr:hypothetical protein [Nitrospinota bacterium]
MPKFGWTPLSKTFAELDMLPPFPVVFNKILEITESDVGSREELLKALSLDQAIAAQVAPDEQFGLLRHGRAGRHPEPVRGLFRRNDGPRNCRSLRDDGGLSHLEISTSDLTGIFARIKTMMGDVEEFLGL